MIKCPKKEKGKEKEKGTEKDKEKEKGKGKEKENYKSSLTFGIYHYTIFLGVGSMKPD